MSALSVGLREIPGNIVDLRDQESSTPLFGFMDGVTGRARIASSARAQIIDMALPPASPIVVPVAELQGQLGAIRLCEPRAVEAIEQSLARHGQLTALEVFAQGDILATSFLHPRIVEKFAEDNS